MIQKKIKKMQLIQHFSSIILLKIKYAANSLWKREAGNSLRTSGRSYGSFKGFRPNYPPFIFNGF